MAEEEVDGAAHVARRPIRRQRVHQLGGLVHLGVLRHLAVVQVGRQGRESLVGQLVAHALDVGVEAPPLLEDDDAGACTFLGASQVAARRVAVARELHVFTHDQTFLPRDLPVIPRNDVLDVDADGDALGDHEVDVVVALVGTEAGVIALEEAAGDRS